MRRQWIIGVLIGLGLVGMSFPWRAAAQPQTQAPDQQQLQSIRTAGYNAGFRDGVTDYQGRVAYNFQSHPVYQNATQGYSQGSGVDQQTYQMDFRTGYEAGYDDGFYGRTSNGDAQRQRDYSGQPALAAARQAGAQASAQPSRRANAGTGTLPAGTALDLKLNNTISSRSSQQGDSFTAAVVAPVYSRNGQTLLVPQGSTVEGTVASVQNSGSVSGKAQIQLDFQSLRLPDGTNLPLRAEVSQITPNGGIGGAITGTPSATNEGGVQQSQTRNTVGTAATGGAAGAIIGAIAGGGKGAGIGGLVGAGLGVVLASRNGGALDLPAGTPMTITLNQPVRVH